MIALIGGSGYIGRAFAAHLQALGQPHAILGRSNVDLYDATRLSRALEELSATSVICAAGFTGQPNVDACELQKAECLRGNAVLPGILREACARLELPFGHVSSGCIYSGCARHGGGFREDDAPNFTFRQNNCSFYSGCKALGEEVLAGADRCYVWRPRIPFNHIDSPRNYISKLIRYDRLLEARNSISHLDEFVGACVQCLLQRLPYGVYNLTNTDSVTTSQVVELIQKWGLTDRSFCYFDSEEHFMREAAKTPRSNCILDNSKALGAGLKLSPVLEALEKALANWVPAAHESA